MSRAVIQSNVLMTDGGVSIAPNATVTIRNAVTNALVTLTTDRAGAVAESNPFQADSNGFFRVYCVPQRVNILAISGETSQELKDVIPQAVALSSDIYTGDAWITPAFSAGNFTGNGSMTWAVESGDVATYKYRINGKTMEVAFVINTTTVGGTLNTILQIAIPASKVATSRMVGMLLKADSGSWATNWCDVAAGGTVIRCFNNAQGNANWSAATNTTFVYGHISFEIN